MAYLSLVSVITGIKRTPDSKMIYFSTPMPRRWFAIVALWCSMVRGAHTIETQDASFYALGSTEVCLKSTIQSLRAARLLAFPMTLVWQGIHECALKTMSCNRLVQGMEFDMEKQPRTMTERLLKPCGAISFTAQAKHDNPSTVQWVWHFSVPRAWIIRFRFTLFDIPYHDKCKLDQLNRFNWGMPSRPYDNPWCGYRPPESIYGFESSLEISLLLWRPNEMTKARVEGVYEWLPRGSLQTPGPEYTDVSVTKPGQLPTGPQPSLIESSRLIFKWKVTTSLFGTLSFSVQRGQVGDLSVFDGPDETMPKASPSGNEMFTSGNSGFVVLAMELNVPAGQQTAQVFYKTHIVPAAKRPNPCYKKQSLSPKHVPDITWFLDNLTDDRFKGFRLCQWQLKAEDGFFLTVRFSRMSTTTFAQLGTCAYGGILFREQTDSSGTFAEDGPICDHESLVQLKSSVYTSRTSTLSFVYFSYQLPILKGLFNTLRVHISLTPCQGLLISCDMGQSITTPYYRLYYRTAHFEIAVNHKKCINIHSYPKVKKQRPPKSCGIRLASAVGQNVVGTLLGYLPSSKRAVVDIPQTSTNPVVTWCEEEVSTIRSGVSTRLVFDNTNIILGTKMFVLSHANRCPYSSGASYHFQVRSDPCEEIRTPSTYPHPFDLYMESTQATLSSECGKVKMPSSYIIIELSMKFPESPESHYEFTIDGEDSLCFRRCKVHSIIILEGNNAFSWANPFKPVSWKTKSINVKVQIELFACWDRCVYVLKYQVKPPSRSLEVKEDDHYCEIQDLESDWVGQYYALTLPSEGASWKDASCTGSDTLVNLNSRKELRALLLAADSSPGCGNLGLIWQKDYVVIGLDALEQNGLFRWSNGDPPAFTEWFDNQVHLPAVIGTKQFPSSLPSRRRCTVMALYTPEEESSWIKVDCYIKIANMAALCERNDREQPTSPPLNFDVVINNREVIQCPVGWNVIDDSCFMLLTDASKPFLVHSDAEDLCLRHDSEMAQIYIENATTIKTYLDIWHHQARNGGVWFVLIGQEESSKGDCTALLPDETGGWLIGEMDCHSSNQSQRMNVLCRRGSEPVYFTCRPTQFQCKDLSCILSYQRCDKRAHCADGSDELNCETVLPGVPSGSFTKQKNGCGTSDIPLHYECATGECLPLSWVCNGVDDCLDGYDEIFCNSKPKRTGQDCSHKLCEQNVTEVVDIRLSQLRPPSAQDRMNETTLLPCNSYYYSGIKDMADLGPCTNGFGSPCLPRYMSCILDYTIRDEVCDGEMTFDSCPIYRCPGHFKCKPKTLSGGYCIPLSRVCDHYRDCELGEDEENCNKKTDFCRGKFLCTRRKVCISQANVCDGFNDCHSNPSQSEDEMFCDVICPPGCLCLGFGIMCRGLAMTSIPTVSTQTQALILPDNNLEIYAYDLYPYEMLLKIDFSGNRLRSLNFLLHFHSYDLFELRLSRNLLFYIPPKIFHSFENLLLLDLRENPLSFIQRSAFSNLWRLPALHLEHMQIQSISKVSETSLISLEYLNLSYNRLHYLAADSFHSMEYLLTLDLRGNPLHLIHQHTFKDIYSLRNLYTTEYKFCCAAKNAESCEPPPDEFSSCDDLMRSSQLRICVWVLGLMGVFANLGVMLWRRQDKTPLAFLIQNLGIADFLMGIYLLIIAGADTHYRNRYYLYDEIWRASITCRAAGFLSMLSSEMSVYVLVLITIDRIRAVAQGAIGIRSDVCKALVVAGWVIFTLLSALPVAGLSYFGDTDYIRHGVCFLFNLTEGKVKGWEYATAVFIAFNLFALSVLVIGYTYTFIKVSIKTGFSGSVEARMARRLALIVLTDCMCWIPPITIGIMSLRGETIQPQVAVWIAIFVFPINSSLNPFLYTFSTVRCDEEPVVQDDSDELRLNATRILEPIDRPAPRCQSVSEGAFAPDTTRCQDMGNKTATAAASAVNVERQSAPTERDLPTNEQFTPESVDLQTDLEISVSIDIHAGTNQDIPENAGENWEEGSKGSTNTLGVLPRRHSSRKSIRLKHWTGMKSVVKVDTSSGGCYEMTSRQDRMEEADTRGQGQGELVVAYSKDPATLEENAQVKTAENTAL